MYSEMMCIISATILIVLSSWVQSHTHLDVVPVRAREYVTSQSQAIVSPSCVTPGCSLTDGYDFNPHLLGGIRGAAGIKARLNQRGFQYASAILTPILNSQIKKARLPNINQCIEELNGNVQVYNLYVSRYRCPQRIVLYPSPPNLLVLSVQNVDIGVTGNLAGQINILIPIALFGIIQVNVHQVSITVSLTLNRGPTGNIYFAVASCQLSVGYVDACIENGGLVGDIANSQFRGQISSRIRNSLPSQVCNQIPTIVNDQLNSRLGIIPQSIRLSQLLQTALSAFGLNNLLSGGGQCPSSCASKKAAAAPKGPVEALALQKLKPPQPSVPPPVSLARPPNTVVFPYATQPQNAVKNVAANRVGSLKSGGTLIRNRVLVDKAAGDLELLKTPQIVKPERAPEILVQLVDTPRLVLAPNQLNLGTSNGTRSFHRTRVFASAPPQFLSSGSTSRSTPHLQRLKAGISGGNIVAVSGEKLNSRDRRQTGSPSPNHVIFADPNNNVCANCPGGMTTNPLSFLSVVLTSLDFSKLSDIYLTIQLLQSYATINDFTVELNGEFSPGGRGGTPFGAFPMFFPQPMGNKMAEILVSDFTVNSLFYHLHRVGFLTVRIGPDTPRIGELLRTTCSSEEADGGGLEDHGVETDDTSLTGRKKRELSGFGLNFTNLHRRKRQDNSLSDLGICFGDILPAVRERYPNQRIVILIRTARAPSVVLSARNGGTASLDFVIDADFYIESTNQKVGTIQAAALVDFTVRTGGGRLSARADICRLQLRDVGNSLGLPQDALDNLGTLGKEVILKAGNDALAMGTSLSLPPGVAGLPINLIDTEIEILEHALHIAFDFTVNPSALGDLGGGCGGCGGC